MTTPETPPPDQSPGAISGAKSLEPDRAIGQPPSGSNSFESYMQKGTAPQGTQGTGSAPSPMDIARPTNMQTTGPTLTTLQDQARTAQDTLGTVKQQLDTPNLKLKRSQAHLLKNKLTDSQTYARAAADKIGVETPKTQVPAQGGPLERFIYYVNDGENQFDAIHAKLQEMSASGKQLNAGDMMFMQVKMNLAQQEIEYSSTLLSKVISSITTIMNIQL